MNSNFEYYKIFYFVSKYKNLTKAANALKISQPAVTRTIRNLERDLGCRLFIRCKQGMVHTPEGEMLFKYVSEGCAQFFKGENILENIAGLEKGSVYISATETALHCYLFDAMEEFKANFPKVHFKIFNNSSSDSLRFLKEGRIDIAIVSSPIDTVEPIRQIHLRKYRDILICGKSYMEISERNTSLNELIGYPWISLTSDSFTRCFLDRHFSKNNLEFRPDIEVDTTDMILMAVKHNMGMGFIPPEFAKDAIALGEVMEIKLDEPLTDRCVTMVYDSDAPQSTAAREFRGFLKERIARMHSREEGFRIY